ncbi:SusC/RagA family TonB-linked outer membrane protein [Bacteroidia bacterium]|nr:SusC/RagA family TonB-linked outer membrane protein [Bacteroidia bacterium]
MISLLISIPVNGYTQHPTVTIQNKQAKISALFEEIEAQIGMTIAYNSTVIDVNKIISVDIKNKSLPDALTEILKDTGTTFSIQGKQIVISAISQQVKKITGIITDAQGEPVIGATIRVKGTNTATITDADGKYSIEAVPGSVLQISYIGFSPSEIMIGNQQLADLVLQEDTKLLDEIVVVGFGTQKKLNLTGAVSSITMNEIIGDRPIVNASDALTGNIPGLMVSSGGNSPGQSRSFQIRGAYSVGIKNSNGGYGDVIAPLVLIDNVEGDIDMINPEDIESVTVLKDAASSAIYGARAAGGVILITTKKPQTASKFKLNYNNNFGFGKAYNLPVQAPLMEYLQAYTDAEYPDAYWSLRSPSVKKWMEYLSEYKKNPSAFNIVGDGIYTDESNIPYYLHEKNLIKNFMETSFQMTHNMSVSGGNDKVRYRLSGGYTSNDGVLITNKDKYDRLNINAFGSADITKWFTQDFTLNYAHSIKTLPASPIGAIYSLRLASFYPEGNFPSSMNTLANEDLPFFTSRNQVLLSNKSNMGNDNPRIFLKSILKPLSGWEMIFEYTFDKNVYDYSWYTGKYQYTTIQGGSSNSIDDDYLRKTKNKTDYNAINVYTTYAKNIGSHKLKGMVGFNQESSSYESLDAYSYNQAVIDVPGMGSGTGKVSVKDIYTQYSVRGGFFRLNYSYQDKYLAEINGRYDGSSKFSEDFRFGFFPSVSLGWHMGEENFMKFSRNWLDAFKIRASYGEIGNQNIPAYAYTPTMSLNNLYSGWLINGKYITAINTLPSLVSADFTWEKVVTVDAGLDISLLRNRLTGIFDWYRKDTKGMLAPGVQLPEVVGADAPFQNTADMRTKGWEIALNWRDKINKVSYRFGINLSDYNSEITKYDDNSAVKLLDSFYPGQTIGEIWGYVTDGFYSVDDFENISSWKLKQGVTSINGVGVRPGDVKFKNLRDDENFTNVITEGNNTAIDPGDRKIIGNNSPRYQYGGNIGLNYAGFDFNLMFQGTGKRDYWINNVLTFPLSEVFDPLYDGLSDYWKPVDVANGDYTAVNPDAKYPRIYGQLGNRSSNRRISDKYLLDASYFRIKNITLSYTPPKKWISRMSLEQLRCFISMENVATFSSLPSGIDPETLGWNYPSYRTISFGINFTLQ